MAAKTKCPTCGAKNDVANHRCRICTAVINPDAAAPPPEEPVAPVAVDHFDAGEINRQLQPVRERISSGNGALAARLAAARGASTAPNPAGADGGTELGFAPEPSFSPEASFRPEPTFSPEPALSPKATFSDPPPRASAAPSAAPIEYDDEPFDPDALFRDMG